jgi:hypothetical protein
MLGFSTFNANFLLTSGSRYKNICTSGLGRFNIQYSKSSNHSKNLSLSSKLSIFQA